MHNEFLIKYKYTISDIFSKVINFTFSSGVKIAKVIPVYKGGNNLDPNNYRQISILSCVSKIIEKCVYYRMIKYLDYIQVFHQYQYAFRQRSNSLNVNDVVMEIQDLDNNKLAAVLFTALKNVFDALNHEMLLDKLKVIGFRGLPLN